MKTLRLFPPVFVLLLLLGCAEHRTIAILSTTDLHGHIYPVDYYTGAPTNDGLAKVATLVAAERKKYPDNLLLDAGDLIQGTPLIYYYHKYKPTEPNPIVAVMNHMGYQSYTFGNHDFNFGLERMEKARQESTFPWLAANIVHEKTGEPAFTPYLIKDVGGIKVAILGFITPGVPRWENPENYAGLRFDDIVACAKVWIPRVRETEKPDVLVVAAHTGAGEAEAQAAARGKESSGENVGYRLADEVPGIDLLFLGHSHAKIPLERRGTCVIAQAECWARCLAEGRVTLVKDGGRWRIDQVTSTVIPVEDKTAADPEVLALAKTAHEKTEGYLNQVIGRNLAEMNGLRTRFEPTALMDLIHRVQTDATGAQLSAVSSFNPGVDLPAGPITVRQMASLYVYENTLYRMKMTGEQVRKYLEHAARFFNRLPGKPLVNEKIRGYNFDLLGGVTYEIDVTRTEGQRIQNLSWQGKPLDPKQVFTVAINNYRANGGGGFMEAIGGAGEIDWRSSEEIRNLLIAYVTRVKELDGKFEKNWKLVPEAVAAPAVEEAIEKMKKGQAEGKR